MAMRKEKNYDFRERILKIHKENVRNQSRKAKDNEFFIPDNTVIKISKNAGEVISTAAYDFADFLKTSMNISSSVVTDGKGDIEINIANETAEDIGEFAVYRGFVIKTDGNGIKIIANDERGAASALYYIEDLMCFESAPVISFGVINKKPLYSPQMVHSGYGLDKFPDEYLLRVAHEGRDAILVFTKGVNETPDGYLDFNDLIKRAAKYGIDVYAYSYIKSIMHPEDEGADEYYEGTYGKLFRECPGLKGVTLVGESVGFPSKDPHVTLVERQSDGIPTGAVSSVAYPCEDYPAFLRMIKKTITKYNPNADIVFWTYNWGYQPEDARVKLIENLPEDISLLVTFEMFEPIKYGDATGITADYTLASVGPGKYFASEAIAAKKRGIKLYSMTNTAGLTWDIGTIPYEPMPYQWIKRYKAMQKANEDWGLCGIMESHHYGMYPSFISKLSKHCFYEPRESMEDILKKILISEFGEENFENVNAAMECFSEAICNYTPSDGDQYGAFRSGPSYPLWIYATHICNFEPYIPSTPGALFGSRICRPVYFISADHRISPPAIRIREELKYVRKMLEYMEKGMEHLNKTTQRNENLMELINLGQYITNCVKTGIAAKEWYYLKNRMNVAEDKETLSKIYDDMEALLLSEYKNAEETIPLVEYDSRLGWEPSMLYIADTWHLDWKMRQVKYELETRIKKSRISLEL